MSDLEYQLGEFEKFKIALRTGNPDRVREYLEKYPDWQLANKYDPETRQIPTYIAAQFPTEEKSYELLKILLEEGKADPNYKDAIGQSIMFYICKDGKASCFDLLVNEFGADPDTIDANGQTPLFFAARDNRLECIKKMLEHGVNATIADKLHN